jgi:hypothetical protein
MLPAALRPLRRIPLARLRSRLLSSSASGEGGPPAVASTDEAVRAAKLREEAYKQVANLDWSSNADFWKAVDIVKTLPPKRKEFGSAPPPIFSYITFYFGFRTGGQFGEWSWLLFGAMVES